MDKWLVIPPDANADPIGLATVSVSVALGVDTGVGIGIVPEGSFEFRLPGRPRLDVASRAEQSER